MRATGAGLPRTSNIRALNGGSAAADELQNEHHQRDQKQNMDVCSQNVETHEPQQPQHQQYDEYCPEHWYLPQRKCARFGMVWCAWRRVSCRH